MKVIDLLDCYIEKGDVESIPSEMLDKIVEDPVALVHGALVSFNKLKCDFRFEVKVPYSLQEGKLLLSEADDKSLKYVYALYCMKFQHHITSTLVRQILEKIEV